jgi:hypothetical protein
MNMSENMNIEELLNGYLDGELTTRQETEVQRLIAHDEEVAQQLRTLERCKLLVGSLPPAEAPADMLSQMQAVAERRARLTEDATRTKRGAGARHLLYRKLVTAAALLMLVGALGYVVYVIVSPGDDMSRPGALGEGAVSAGLVDGAVVAGDAGVEGGLDGAIVLRTRQLYLLDQFTQNLVDRNLGARYSVERLPEVSTIFTFRCGRERFTQMMREYGLAWTNVESSRVVLEGQGTMESVDVAIAEADDIAEIFTERDHGRRVALARALSLSNAGGDEQSPLDVIPKPVLTTPEKTVTTEADVEGDIVQISLVLEHIE